MGKTTLTILTVLMTTPSTLSCLPRQTLSDRACRPLKSKFTLPNNLKGRKSECSAAPPLMVKISPELRDTSAAQLDLSLDSLTPLSEMPHPTLTSARPTSLVLWSTLLPLSNRSRTQHLRSSKRLLSPLKTCSHPSTPSLTHASPQLLRSERLLTTTSIPSKTSR